MIQKLEDVSLKNQTLYVTQYLVKEPLRYNSKFSEFSETRYVGPNKYPWGGVYPCDNRDIYYADVADADGFKNLDLGGVPGHLLECSSQHPLGSCRIAASPDAGVVDSWGQVYDVEDLYLADGSVVEVDADYLRESIIDPKAKIVSGFQPVMQSYEGILKDNDIKAFIDYVKTLE